VPPAHTPPLSPDPPRARARPRAPRAAPQLFDAMGQGASKALLTHVIIGAVNVGTTLVAVFTVDR
jgi:hypothetical protein